MAKPQLDPGENLIGNWTIVYKPPAGGMYNGKLYVTDKRLLYDAKFDMTVKGVIEEVFFLIIGSHEYLVLPKDRIKDVLTKSTFLKKQIFIIMDNDEEHIFDYGMLSIKKIAEAINQK